MRRYIETHNPFAPTTERGFFRCPLHPGYLQISHDQTCGFCPQVPDELIEEGCSDLRSESAECHSTEYRFCEEHGICDKCAFLRETEGDEQWAEQLETVVTRVERVLHTVGRGR